MKLVLKNCIASFPSVFEKESYAGKIDDTSKYAVTVLIPEDDPQLKQVKEAIKSVGSEKLGSKWAKAKISLKSHADDDYVPEGYWSLKCTTKRRPVVIDRRKAAITDPEEIYGGCVINVSLSIIAFESKGYGSFIQGQLAAIQKVADGEPLGGGGSGYDDSDFDDFDGDDDIVRDYHNGDDDAAPF